MVRTINAITIPDMNQETAKLYVKLTALNFENEGEVLNVVGEYFYYNNDDENTIPIKFANISKQYTQTEYNALYDSLVLTAATKSEMVKEEINKTLPGEVISTYPNLGLVVGDFESI